MSATQTRRIMRLPDVIATTGFGRSYIYELMKKGKFPQARRIGERAVGWSSHEIEQWVKERLEGV